MDSLMLTDAAPNEVIAAHLKAAYGEPEVKTVKESPKATHGVFYTDGGCKPSRGIGGWGIHGYTFFNEPAKTGTGCKNAVITRDGYKPKDKEVDAGKPDITLDKYIDGVGSLIPESTNNIAELTALLKTYHTVEALGLTDVLVLMDSEYVRGNLEKSLAVWEKNGWLRQDGAAVANIEQWKAISAARKALEEKGVSIRYQWVKGHSGNLGNEIADQWASKGIIAGKNNILVDSISTRDAKGYWNTKLERNRMFAMPVWYFNTHRHPDTWRTASGHHAYHLGSGLKEDDLHGKPDSTSSYSVIHLKQTDPVLEAIRGIQESIDLARYGTVVKANLSEIFSKDTYNEIANHHDRFMVKDYHKARLSTTVGDQLTKEMRPALLSFNAVDSLSILEQTLNEYFAPPENSRLAATDLSTLLYETVVGEKKTTCKLKAEITTSLRSIKVMAKYLDSSNQIQETPLTLTFNHDLPERNTLSALADLVPKVTLITWPESDHAIRYATIVEAGEDRGIWAGIYSNIHVLTSKVTKS
jgi:ribonuclease HI